MHSGRLSTVSKDKKPSRFERAGDEDDGGGASVREPKRPKPKKPSGGATMPIPEPELVGVGRAD